MSYYPAYSFEIHNQILCLSYELYSNDWVREKLNIDGSVILKGIFEFTKDDIVDTEDTVDFDELDSEDPFNDERRYVFRVGCLDGDYYHIDRIRHLQHKLYLHKDVKISMKTFLHHGKVSIFNMIDDLVDHDIYVGGDNESAFSLSDFDTLLQQFPTEYEINKYRTARISSIIKEVVDLKKDYQADFEKYLNKRSARKPLKVINKPQQRDNEVEKYKLIKTKLEAMLQDKSISEKDWQQEILEFILLLFPKYIKVIRELPIRDSFSGTTRHVDFALVDSSGYLDIVEIKKPDEQGIVSSRTYRDNHIPIKDLSGAIMQVEKYILHLNKWGQAGEIKLNEQYRRELPDGCKLKIINPSGLIIMGSTKGLTSA